MKLKIVTTGIIMLMGIISFGQAKKNTPAVVMPKKVLGSMTVTDGMLNGQKTMLSQNEVLYDLVSQWIDGEGRKDVEIKSTKTQTILIVKHEHGDYINTCTLPLLVNKQGYLVTIGKATFVHVDTNTEDNKTTTKKVTLPKKNDYVGHVTLLK